MNNILKKTIFFAPLVFVFGLLMVGCNEEPTEVGYSFLRDSVELYPLSSKTKKIISGNRSIRLDRKLVNYNKLYIGAGHETKAMTMLRFESLVMDKHEHPKASDISDIKIFFHPNTYKYGNQEGIQSFSIHEIKSDLTPHVMDRASSDNLSQIKWSSFYSGDQLSNKINSEVMASYKGNINDVLKEKEDKDRFIEIPVTSPVAAAMIARWINHEKWTDSVKAQLKKDTIPYTKNHKHPSLYNWGIVFTPNDDSQVINSWYAQEGSDKKVPKNPYISFKLKDTVRTITGKDTVVKDTVYNYSVRAGMDLSIAHSEEPKENELVVQGLTEYITSFEFDLSALPSSVNIHKAQFEFYLDEKKTHAGSGGIDTILHAKYFKSSVISVIGDKRPDDALLVQAHYKIARDTATNQFKLKDLSKAIKYMIMHRDNSGKVKGVFDIFADESDRKELDRLYFHGIDAVDPNKRPALKIIYSVVKKKESEK